MDSSRTWSCLGLASWPLLSRLAQTSSRSRELEPTDRPRTSRTLTLSGSSPRAAFLSCMLSEGSSCTCSKLLPPCPLGRREEGRCRGGEGGTLSRCARSERFHTGSGMKKLTDREKAAPLTSDYTRWHSESTPILQDLRYVVRCQRPSADGTLRSPRAVPHPPCISVSAFFFVIRVPVPSANREF